jgi:hypothetical protein
MDETMGGWFEHYEVGDDSLEETFPFFVVRLVVGGF